MDLHVITVRHAFRVERVDNCVHEPKQGLPGSNRRRRFWRPLCFHLHQAPLSIPDRTRTCTAGTGIRYGHPFHHGDKALPKRFELLYDSLEGCCSYPLSYGNIMRPQAAFSVFSTIITVRLWLRQTGCSKPGDCHPPLSKVCYPPYRGGRHPSTELYMFDLSLIASISFILSAEIPLSFAILFMFSPVLTRSITGKWHRMTLTSTAGLQHRMLRNSPASSLHRNLMPSPIRQVPVSALWSCLFRCYRHRYGWRSGRTDTCRDTSGQLQMHQPVLSQG